MYYMDRQMDGQTEKGKYKWHQAKNTVKTTYSLKNSENNMIRNII